MHLSRIFIERPVMTALITFAILVFGLVGYHALPVAALPNVDYPTIQVSAALPGANPETMAATVATPLERQFSTIAGIETMSSSSTLGSTFITIQFSLERNIDAASQDVQGAIARAGGLLPAQMPRPPSFQKLNPADVPVLYLALTSKTLPLYTVDAFAQSALASRLSISKGVSQVSLIGGQKYAVRVELNPNELVARGIGFDDVLRAVQENNVSLPLGTLQGAKQAFTVQSDGQLFSAASYRPVIVVWKNGNPVRLEELGHIVDDVENTQSKAWMDKDRAIVLAIYRQPGTNVVEVVDGIKALLPIMQSEIPPALDLTVVWDRSQDIRKSIDDVKFTLVLTVCLVILVISLFLRNIAATLIPGVAVPLSIVGTFAVMQLLGYSLNNLSLMALTLSVGFVVDDAVVMLENIVRFREMGKSRMEAAFAASREIGFTIVSMTLSLIAVFVPVLFMGGIVGRLLHEFAVTIAVAILLSGFISLTLTPMLASRFLKYDINARRGIVPHALETGFNAIADAYDYTLQKVLRHRLVTLVFAFATLGGTFYLFFTMPTGFLPSEDSGVISGSAMGGQDISYESMAKHMRSLADIALADPNADRVFAGAFGGNRGNLFIRLKPRSERKLDADHVIQELRPKFETVPGVLAFLQNPPPINVGGNGYSMTLQSTKLEEVQVWAPRLVEKLSELPGFFNVTSDLQIQNPEVRVSIDRDRARAVGVTPLLIEDTIFSAFSSRLASTFYTPSDQYSVIVEVAPEYQRDPEALSKLYVHSAGGQLVPLDTVASVKRTTGPLSVNHFGQLPAVTVSFNLAPGFPLGQAADKVNEMIRELHVPQSVSVAFQGTVKEFQRSFRGLSILLVIAVLVIYSVLGILYESFLHPITILSGLPSAACGALLTLVFFHKQLDLYAFVGLIMLMGVVKKNAIMMIDFALATQRLGGKTAREAIHQGCLRRFRPIMMTTAAALFGTLPIALGYGQGGEARQPLGLAVVGGLVVSQVLTLYVTPVVYLYVEQLRSRVDRRNRRSRETQPEQVLIEA